MVGMRLLLSPTGRNAYVLEGDTHNIRWQLTDLGETKEVAVADTNKDGISEVLIGNGQWGSVTGYQGTDGELSLGYPQPGTRRFWYWRW